MSSEDTYMHGSTTNSTWYQQLGGLIRKRKASDSDPTMADKSTDNPRQPSSHEQAETESSTQASVPESYSGSEAHAQTTTTTPYNGPSKVYVAILRVAGESSSRPVPQSAFFSLDKALVFGQNVLIQFCENRFDDFTWQGPETVVKNCIFRYVAVDTESDDVVAAADVIRVGIFDAGETEVQDRADSKTGGKVGRGQMEGNDEAMGFEWEAMLQKFPEAVVRQIARNRERVEMRAAKTCERLW